MLFDAMKQRITYITEPQVDTAKHVTTDWNTLSIRLLEAAKEHRFTIGLEELPEEVWFRSIFTRNEAYG